MVSEQWTPQAGKDVSALHTRTSDVQREIADINAALSGAVSRRDAAANHEHEADIQTRVDENAGLAEEYAAALRARTVKIMELREAFAAEDRLEQKRTKQWIA